MGCISLSDGIPLRRSRWSPDGLELSETGEWRNEKRSLPTVLVLVCDDVVEEESEPEEIFGVRAVPNESACEQRLERVVVQTLCRALSRLLGIG